MRERVKTQNDNGLRIWKFSQKWPFSGEKTVSKTNLGSTIHYTYSSFNKYFRLCMVSEELRLNEIGLFLQYFRYNEYFLFLINSYKPTTLIFKMKVYHKMFYLINIIVFLLMCITFIKYEYFFQILANFLLWQFAPTFPQPPQPPCPWQIIFQSMYTQKLHYRFLIHTVFV